MLDPGINYIRHVLEVKGWSPAELARHAKLAHSTINRPLTQKNWPNKISRQTLGKIYHATGIDPSPFLAEAGEPSIISTEEALSSGFAETGAELRGRRLQAAIDGATSAPKNNADDPVNTIKVAVVDGVVQIAATVDKDGWPELMRQLDLFRQAIGADNWTPSEKRTPQ